MFSKSLLQIVWGQEEESSGSTFKAVRIREERAGSLGSQRRKCKPRWDKGSRWDRGAGVSRSLGGAAGLEPGITGSRTGLRGSGYRTNSSPKATSGKKRLEEGRAGSHFSGKRRFQAGTRHSRERALVLGGSRCILPNTVPSLPPHR